MTNMILIFGRVVGVLGLLICASSIALRLMGKYWMFGFQVGTLFAAGIACVAMGCFALLWAMSTSGQGKG